MDGVLRVGGVACVAVKGDASQVRAHGWVAGEGFRVLRVVPVVLVAEDAGGDIGGGVLDRSSEVGPRRAQGGAQISRDKAALVERGHEHTGIAGVAGGLVQRFVLDRQVVDRDAVGLVRLDELGEVAGERGEVGGIEGAAVEACVGFHPGGRGPWYGFYLDGRVRGERGLERGDNVGLVVRDGELLHLRVGRARGEVVVGVARKSEVGGAHGLAQEAEVDTARGKQVLHKGAALGWGELGPDQVGGGIGERSARACELLVADAVVDGDGQFGVRARGKGEGGLRGEELALVGGGLDDADRLRL